VTSRNVSEASALRKAGVADPERVAGQIAQIEAATGLRLAAAGVNPAGIDAAGINAAGIDPVGIDLAAVADPDLAVLQLLRLVEAATESGHLDRLIAVVAAPTAARLAAILGASSALGDFLIRHPALVSTLASPEPPLPLPASTARAALLVAVGADPSAAVPVATILGAPGVDALRLAYRTLLLRVASEDVSSSSPVTIVPMVAEALADLAGAALEAGLALARAEEPAYAETRLAIIAMGKCGARELNYVSDVDVIFVAEPGQGANDEHSIAVATRLATAAARACDRASGELALWQVDANLRPEGKDGALVRNVASHRAYYERWASTWEFQALLKARPVAGDLEVGAAYIAAVGPLVWEASRRENFVEDAQAMRRRVEEHVPAGEADRQIKLGPGGLRDVEFTIQLLQLVHGRADESLRIAPTLAALAALRTGGYVGRDEADRMDRAYRQLRVWEHRVQMARMRRTHLLPDSEEGLRALARASGFPSSEALLEAWHAIRRDVRSMHLEMFYRPILPVVARLSAGEASLDTDAARERLAAIGFADPEAAQRHLAALTEGVSRKAAIQRQLLPAMIGWFAEGPDPDAGLLAFRTLSEQLKEASWYLKMLRDSGTAAERLARLLSTSAYVTEALLASAEDVTWLDKDEDLEPRDEARLFNEADAILTRSQDVDQCITALRGLRRRELARTAAADVLGLLDTLEAATTITHVADVVLGGALRIAMSEAGGGKAPFDMAIIAMGRYGGMEMSYPSDADVMFVYEPHEGADHAEADRIAQHVATEVRRLLQTANPQPPLDVDVDLRPEGKNGPLARSLASTAEYYGRWSEPWEAQALLRARPAAGDAGVRARFVEAIDAIRFPAELTPDALKQMRMLKARMESERLPRGIEPRRHVKLGPGGLADVEWTIQLLQLLHAHEHPELRTTLTLPAIEAAVTARVLSRADATVLAEAWRLATRLRGAMALRGYALQRTNVIPGDARELKALAGILGDGWTGVQLDEYYARAARRARAVTERVFYGWDREDR
jgi:glutamate-ammonia-ligase adenylyltransferase